MLGILHFQNAVLSIVHIALLAVTIFAFLSSLTFSSEAYRAAGKWSKGGWTILLGIGCVVQLTGAAPMLIIQIALLVAAFVYLADVRPALRGLIRR